MSHPEPGDLAANVRHRRTAKGMSQYQLAAESGVSRSVIARVEAGHLASLRIVSALAKALGTTPDRLLRKLPRTLAA